jgi:hypothetical protein
VTDCLVPGLPLPQVRQKLFVQPALQGSEKARPQPRRSGEAPAGMILSLEQEQLKAKEPVRFAPGGLLKELGQEKLVVLVVMFDSEVPEEQFFLFPK